MLLHKSQSTVLQLIVFSILFTSCLIFIKRRFPTRKKTKIKKVFVILFALVSAVVLTYMFFALYEKHFVVNRVTPQEPNPQISADNVIPEAQMEIQSPAPASRPIPNSPVQPPQPFLRFDGSSAASSYTDSDASTILTSI